MQQREARDHNVRKIEWAIRNERRIAEAIEESRLAPGGYTGGGPSGHSYVSDPTAAQAIRATVEVRSVMIDGRRLEWPERWLDVISAVRNWCGKDTIRAEIFKRRYKGDSYLSTCHKLHIAERTYHYALHDIRVFAVQCAAQAQVIRVF